MSKDCGERKHGNNNKKFKKAEEVIGRAEDNVVLCLLTMENKKESVKKKIWFAEDVKQPSEAGVTCTICSDMFYSFTKNTWIRDSRASWHITNDYTSMYDITDINESIQGSSSIMPPMKKGKLHVNATSRWD